MKHILHFLAIAALTCGTLVFAAAPPPQLKSAEPWSPHPKTTPVTARQGAAFAVEANGTRMSTGGWQWTFEGIVPGQTYELSTSATHDGLSVPRDELRCIAIWGKADANKERFVAIWDYLLPETSQAKAMRFTRKLVAPEGAHQLVIRSTLRWTAEGKAVWQQPKVSIAQTPLAVRPPVKVSVVTGRQSQRTGLKFKSIQDNMDFYGKLIEKACERDHPQLVVLPEVAQHDGDRFHSLCAAWVSRCFSGWRSSGSALTASASSRYRPSPYAQAGGASSGSSAGITSWAARFVSSAVAAGCPCCFVW